MEANLLIQLGFVNTFVRPEDIVEMENITKAEMTADIVYQVIFFSFLSV